MLCQKPIETAAMENLRRRFEQDAPAAPRPPDDEAPRSSSSHGVLCTGGTHRGARRMSGNISFRSIKSEPKDDGGPVGVKSNPKWAGGTLKSDKAKKKAKSEKTDDINSPSKLV